MITGLVTAQLEALIRVTVGGPRGRVAVVEAVVDTGYDGHLTLPPALIVKVGLPWQRRGRAELADGSESVFDVYAATVRWHRQLRRVAIDEVVTKPLVGMRRLPGSELSIVVRPGGRVTVERL